MRFVYKNKRGEVKEVDLGDSWEEQGKYIAGFDASAGHAKTYLKWRVVEYLDQSELKLSDPFSPAPLAPVKAWKRQVLFTGFPSVQKRHLQHIAISNNMDVVGTVTNNLEILVCGPNAGPAKLQNARLKGCYIFNEADFLNFVDTGEYPDGEHFL